MKYAKVDNVLSVIKALLLDVQNYETFKAWIESPNFESSILDELIEEQEVGTEEDLVNNKLMLLDDLLVQLEKFEDEQRNMQLNKFKQLELLRLASSYVNRSKGTITGRFEHDESYVTETKECGHPPCGKVFIADPPTKMYCSEKCREKAKKWRKRHGNE